MAAPADRSQADVVLVLEVADALAAQRRARGRRRADARAAVQPPWGGCRFFCVDPDGYLVEIEQPA